jgi:hypothetical protein
MIGKTRKRGWLGKLLCSAALGVGSCGGLLSAAEPADTSVVPVPLVPATPHGLQNVSWEDPGPVGPCLSTGCQSSCDPCAPAWCDPVSRVPNFFGSFFAPAATHATRPILYTGVGAEGGDFATIVPPVLVNGPAGPVTLQNTIPVNNLNLPTFTLSENGELTPVVTARFPGATFANGGGQFFNAVDANLFYLYSFTSGINGTISLPNPSGGGAVGRNNFFDNGSPVPHDRLYFYYDHIGDYSGLGPKYNLDRYVFGAEKAFFHDLFSIEIRVPFAGTANSDQQIGDALDINHVEFGNIGLAFKAALIRTPNFLLSVGIGFSFPTANETKLYLDAVPDVIIENRAVLLEPLLGVVWAPNDRFYAQMGLQFDLDPTGNPVQAAIDPTGDLARIGVLEDQAYMFLSGAAGYWVYQNPGGFLTGVAVQGELEYDCSFGNRDAVQLGSVAVTDATGSLDIFSATAGVICTLCDHTYLSLGVNVPLGGDHKYDWSLVAQLNCYFGGPR